MYIHTHTQNTRTHSTHAQNTATRRVVDALCCVYRYCVASSSATDGLLAMRVHRVRVCVHVCVYVWCVVVAGHCCCCCCYARASSTPTTTCAACAPLRTANTRVFSVHRDDACGGARTGGREGRREGRRACSGACVVLLFLSRAGRVHKPTRTQSHRSEPNLTAHRPHTTPNPNANRKGEPTQRVQRERATNVERERENE